MNLGTNIFCTCLCNCVILSLFRRTEPPSAPHSHSSLSLHRCKRDWRAQSTLFCKFTADNARGLSWFYFRICIKFNTAVTCSRKNKVINYNQSTLCEYKSITIIWDLYIFPTLCLGKQSVGRKKNRLAFLEGCEEWACPSTFASSRL